jgi:hypothetical protein
METYRVLRRGLVAGVIALGALPASTLAQPECEQLRRDCADYCRYGPVSPDQGRECKEECRKRVQACQRGQRAMEGYPTYGAPGAYGAPGYAGAPYGGAPYAGVPYGGAPSGGVPYGGAPHGGYGAPAVRAPAPVAPQAPATEPPQRGPVGGRAPQ